MRQRICLIESFGPAGVIEVNFLHRVRHRTATIATHTSTGTGPSMKIAASHTDKICIALCVWSPLAVRLVSDDSVCWLLSTSVNFRRALLGRQDVTLPTPPDESFKGWWKVLELLCLALKLKYLDRDNFFEAGVTFWSHRQKLDGSRQCRCWI